MRTGDVISGLRILEDYRRQHNGFDVHAEENLIVARFTDKEVSHGDRARLRQLGWFQDSGGPGSGGGSGEYNKGCRWVARV